ncbi:hypothetical protein R3Q06_33405 [Rhodococcus erythropolis]|uniref:hypothetical protein n=1 Tax=Rhodococcus erythropolis TaxID=1833 RepID=UPI00294A607B|nr:hypothetical protein [Rhodococcus erythropolis]MDV6278338.1 hypothetical protein [Rhodococcus erythropolis]
MFTNIAAIGYIGQWGLLRWGLLVVELAALEFLNVLTRCDADVVLDWEAVSAVFEVAGYLLVRVPCSKRWY